jgi:hypothetical protein
MKSAADLAREARERVARDFAPREREMARSTPVEVPPVGDLDRVRAFLTEAKGTTLITAPATLPEPDEFEKAMTPNPHFMYVAGAFVGAEKANRNGALWSTQDLEFGEPSVKHGPLNWLHEERKIVGALADARLVQPEVAEGREAAAEPARIDALAVMWRFVWPHEARVMAMAAEQNRLWYSMECVSKTVECADHGCGEFPYMDAIKQVASVCDHVRLKTGTRRFVEPAFLGGAVIVPPVRPGWPDAHVKLMERASAQAEKAYDQAGRPDVSAGEWERLMAQVLSYAEGTAA